MRRVNLICQHPEFKANLALNMDCEKDRIFCRHDMGHFLDVARIAAIISLKEAIEIGEELVYAAALLHDIARNRQYEGSLPHELEGLPIAKRVLRECNFTETETDCVLDAVRHHRNSSIREEGSLRGILYRADKLSRICFACTAREQCSWEHDKKNLEIIQ